MTGTTKKTFFVILLMVILLWSHAVSLNLTFCKTFTSYNSNDNEENHDLVVVSVIISEDMSWYQWLSNKWKYIIQYLSDLPAISNLNVNYIIYHGLRGYCSTAEVALDILLNRDLNYGRPFKIIAILTHITNSELADLAVMMSPYSIPVIPMLPLRSSILRYNQRFQDYYDNVLLGEYFEDTDKLDFLFNFATKFNVKLLSILYDSNSINTKSEIDVISEYLVKRGVCVNIYHLPVSSYHHKLNSFINKDKANVFVIIYEDFKFSTEMIKLLNNGSNKTRLAIIYNYDWTNKKQIRSLEQSLLGLKMLHLYTFILEGQIRDDHQFFYSYFYKWIESVRRRITLNTSKINLILGSDTPARTFGFKYHIPFHSIMSPMLDDVTYYAKLFSKIYNVDLYLLKKRNNTMNKSLIYSFDHQNTKVNPWKCQNCEILSDLEPVCTRNICSAGHYPIHLPTKCCWVCHICSPEFVKSSEGQHECTKCNSSTITNQNQTKCLPFSYHYFKISLKQRITAISLSSVGCAYIICFLAIFAYYKDTPIVKSSNLNLSIFQMSLHLVLNLNLAITVFAQTHHICFVQSIIGGYLLQLIMSIYIIKINKLLTVFTAEVLLERSVCLSLQEIAFPAVYITMSIFITAVYSALHHISDYGILNGKESLIKYKYCNTASYFYVDVSLVIILSVICSIKAFLARKLPANYNETCYIFLAMFTSTIFLLLSVPLDASYRGDGQNIFVNSCMVFATNMSLISIAYGYKVHIVLFQRHKNTKEAFQATRFTNIQRKL